MKTFNKHILAAAFMVQAGAAMAQELNSAYFTEDFKYRHDMNPAMGNDQGYFAIPVLGNFNVQLQSSLGVGDFFFKNPDYGVKAGAKKTTTFMHPGISTEEALKGFKKGANPLLLDLDLMIASVGFKAFNGYNTVELRERTHIGLSMPYDFFSFAKNLRNQDYSFDMGVRAWSYAELALGHSRQLYDNLRVGAKVKLLFGVARADLSTEGLHANLTNDKWVIDGQAKMLLNMKGLSFREEEEEYGNRPGTYKRIDGFNDYEGFGLSGFGLGLDLGAVYEFKDCSVSWLNGLRTSLALTDLGFINWNNGLLAELTGKAFEFDGFNNIDLKDGDDKHTLGDEMDDFTDDFEDFYNLESKGSNNSNTNALAATLRFGLEYPLPVYDRLTFGSLLTHRFDGKYSWTEERISANIRPLNWVDGGINVAFTSFCTTMGWVLNFHPKGMNIFVGMDHMIGKTTTSMIPLDSNFSFNFGLNVAWGGKKKSGKNLATLTF